MKIHFHQFRKVQTRQLKELTVAPRRHIFPYCRHWDLKPQDDMPHDWHGNASQYQRCPWRRILCGGKGGGSLRCRCAIRHGKVLLQHQQGAAELKRNQVSTCFRAAIVDLWCCRMEITLDLIFFCTHIFNVQLMHLTCSKRLMESCSTVLSSCVSSLVEPGACLGPYSVILLAKQDKEAK